MEGTLQLVGSKLKFEITMKASGFHQKGIGNPWNEGWTRMKPRVLGD
jgi:hypothetical protein